MMSRPIHISLSYGTFFLHLTTAFYFNYGICIKLPQYMLSVFPTYVYGNADETNTKFPERKGKAIKMLYQTPARGMTDWGIWEHDINRMLSIDWHVYVHL